MTITKLQLKQEIDYLDEQYVELAYRILRQFPHLSHTVKKSSLIDTLSTLEEIDEEFPNVDENMLPLDNITL